MRLTSNKKLQTVNSKKIIYLTFNDSPSGIYKSQVIDRLSLLRIQGKDIQLVAFCPNLNYKKHKEQILNWDSSALVKKQLPGLQYWWLNLFQLFTILIKLKPQILIGRSIYATNLAFFAQKLKFTKKVIYDGRGAVTAECEEFNMVPKSWLPQIKKLEKKAVNNSNKQFAVSNALVNYWRVSFSFDKSSYSVTPCTLGKQFDEVELSETTISEAKKTIGFDLNDIVVAYSGSLAGWQFKGGLELELASWLCLNENHKLLFLCKPHKKINFLKNQYKTQVVQHFVKPEEVPNYLIAADYGLLVRDQNVTNKVASPVKFAEYLACGLKVIISKNLGDYSRLVEKFELGFIFSNLKFQQTQKISLVEKNLVRSKSVDYFSQQSKLDKLFDI